jgi:hypothetical protein
MNDTHITAKAEQPAPAPGSTVGEETLASRESAGESSPVGRRLADACIEFFTLRRRLTQARSDGYDEGSPGWRQFEFARSAIVDAQQLAASREGERSALLLYRSALVLLIHADRAGNRANQPTALDAADGWKWFAESERGKNLISEVPSADVSLLTEIMTNPCAETYLADRSRSVRHQAMKILGNLDKALADELNGKAAVTERILRLRTWRIVLAATAACLMLGASIKPWIIPSNLALNRHVMLSSNSTDWGVDPHQVVDGDTTNLGFHTSSGADQSVTIDLGRNLRIRRVEVFNRSDCCKERAVPLRLELSTDGTTFSQVLQHTTVFDQWSAHFPPTSARFVRLKHVGDGIFHLSEIEVY